MAADELEQLRQELRAARMGGVRWSEVEVLLASQCGLAWDLGRAEEELAKADWWTTEILQAAGEIELKLEKAREDLNAACGFAFDVGRAEEERRLIEAYDDACDPYDCMECSNAQGCEFWTVDGRCRGHTREQHAAERRRRGL